MRIPVCNECMRVFTAALGPLRGSVMKALEEIRRARKLIRRVDSIYGVYCIYLTSRVGTQ